jgi:Fe-S-cluster containining protein
MPSVLSTDVRLSASTPATALATSSTAAVVTLRPSGTNASPLGFMAQSTPQLRAAVAKLAEAMPAAEFEGVIGSIRSAFMKYSARLLETAPGAERGRALHRMIEREMGVAGMFPTSCSKGCSGCCHYEVEVTKDEAAVLKERVEAGFAIDRARLAVQAARERRSAEWRKFGSADNRCVFLGAEGACGIYEDRPSICRKHMVTTPAAACTTDGAAVAPVQVLLAEIALSAGLSLDGVEFGSLAKMLSRELAA